jgi:hypothetical protein
MLKRLAYLEKIGYAFWCQPSVDDENTDASTNERIKAMRVRGWRTPGY